MLVDFAASSYNFPMQPAQSFTVIALCIYLLAGCSPGSSPTVGISTPAQASITQAPTSLALPTETQNPTHTPPPMAIQVNGMGVWLEDYLAELQRYQLGLQEMGLEEDEQTQKKNVQDDLIAQLLLAGAARQSGFDLDDAQLQERIDQIIERTGGKDKYDRWLTNHLFNEESFRRMLRLAVLAAWQRDQIAAAVPNTIEQVHVLQIRVSSGNEAAAIYQRLQTGADFATVAKEYDPLGSGDLGWFPRGYLTMPEVEAAAFQLAQGKYSQVIESSIGYHIVYVLARDLNHPLSPDAYSVLQHQALIDWVNEERKTADIVISAP